MVSTKRNGAQFVATRADPAHQGLVDHDLAQEQGLLGQTPIAIFQLGLDSTDIVLARGLGQTSIEFQALSGVGDVVVGQERRNVDRDFRIVLGADGLSAQFGDGFLQDASVGVETDGRNQPRLLGA